MTADTADDGDGPGTDDRPDADNRPNADNRPDADEDRAQARGVGAAGDDGAGDPPDTVGADAAERVDLSAVVDDGPVLLFDGVCNLCNGVVQVVVEHDPQGVIRFASLQSDVGGAVLDRLDVPRDELESVVLVEGGGAYTKSAAVIRVCELLGGVYGLAGVGWLVPRRLRDRLYDAVADRRYQWFGRRDQCMVPTPELRSRFVE